MRSGQMDGEWETAAGQPAGAMAQRQENAAPILTSENGEAEKTRSGTLSLRGVGRESL